MAVTMILITFSFLFCWGPDILQSALQFFYWDIDIIEKLFGKFYDKKSAHYLGDLVSYLLYYMSTLNVIFDPLIFFFRMKIVRESAAAMFKQTKISVMTPSSEMSVVTEVSSQCDYFGKNKI
jgi:hypothetical protein